MCDGMRNDAVYVEPWPASADRHGDCVRRLAHPDTRTPNSEISRSLISDVKLSRQTPSCGENAGELIAVCPGSIRRG
jgi:hypothetical protein